VSFRAVLGGLPPGSEGWDFESPPRTPLSARPGPEAGRVVPVSLVGPELAALALGGSNEVISLAIRVNRGVDGWGGIKLAAGMLARAISYWVASLSSVAGRATLKVTMQVNGGEG